MSGWLWRRLLSCCSPAVWPSPGSAIATTIEPRRLRPDRRPRPPEPSRAGRVQRRPVAGPGAARRAFLPRRRRVRAKRRRRRRPAGRTPVSKHSARQEAAAGPLSALPRRRRPRLLRVRRARVTPRRQPGLPGPKDRPATEAGVGLRQAGRRMAGGVGRNVRRSPARGPRSRSRCWRRRSRWDRARRAGSSG